MPICMNPAARYAHVDYDKFSRAARPARSVRTPRAKLKPRQRPVTFDNRYKHLLK